ASGGGTLHDFHRIAIHEFGHALGLDHPDEANQTVVAIMNAFESNIDSLQQDDINGADFLYGAPSPAPTPTPPPAAADNLVNLSTRGFVGRDDRMLIGGFIVQGAQPTSVVLRALGPSLATSGLAGTLPDPVIELRDASGNVLQTNDDWKEDPSAATINSKGLAPKDERESALMASVSSGNYTLLVHGYNGVTGIGLVELYDLQATSARAANISTRGTVLTGDGVMIAGFIVGGDEQKPVILRALGPSLASSGVSGVLGNPTLELYNSGGTLIGSNDDWRNGPDAGTIQSKGLAPAKDRESALLRTLNPGSYTAVLRGFNGGTGVALAEVYDLSPPPNQ
nr:matrixin family metalloprotease [Chthoniobacterales bacterium]